MHRIAFDLPRRTRARLRLVELFDVLLTWQQRAKDRRSLLELDDRLLRDIGLSRADILREAEKPFWRP